MNTGVGLLIAAALFAGSALADPAPAAVAPTPAPTPIAPTTSAPTPAAAKPPASGTKTVEGLTVTGKPFPTKECASRDKDCIAMVVAELKRLYPEQLKRFCFQRQMRAIRNSADFGDVDQTSAAPGPAQMGGAYSMAAPLGVACARDKK